MNYLLLMLAVVTIAVSCSVIRQGEIDMKRKLGKLDAFRELAKSPDTKIIVTDGGNTDANQPIK